MYSRHRLMSPRRICFTIICLQKSRFSNELCRHAMPVDQVELRPWTKNLHSWMTVNLGWNQHWNCKHALKRSVQQPCDVAIIRTLKANYCQEITAWRPTQWSKPDVLETPHILAGGWETQWERPRLSRPTTKMLRWSMKTIHESYQIWRLKSSARENQKYIHFCL